MLKKIVGLAIVVVALAGGAIWYLTSGDSPEELSLDSGEPAEATGERPESFDGTWEVQAGGDTTAGFRITEELANGLRDHEAVGRSAAVTGSVEVQGTEVTGGSFTVDLTELEFTDDPGIPVANRANAMRSRGLETDRFPEATLEITAPIELGEIPADGETATAEVTGDLTLHGVTRQVTFTVEAEVSGDAIRVVTADPVPVVLADFDIDKPSAPVVADIADEGSFEFLVVLRQA